MKKKIKDLSVKEIKTICRKYINGNCSNCPLYFGSNDFESFCIFDFKNIEDEMVGIEDE